MDNNLPFKWNKKFKAMIILKFPIENSKSEMFIMVDYITRFKSEGDHTIIYYSDSEEFYIKASIEDILEKIKSADADSVISIGYPSYSIKEIIDAQLKQKL